MISEKYMVSYTPSRLEKIKELPHSNSVCGDITIESGCIVLNVEYDDEFARQVYRQMLLKAIKGIRVIKDINANKKIYELK